MSEIQYMTQEGFNRLREELEELRTTGRMEASRAIAEARDKGDLSENAAYDAAKEAQGMLQLKISEMEKVLSSARVISESQLDISKVTVLAKVKIRNTKNKAEMVYHLVSESEANLKLGTAVGRTGDVSGSFTIEGTTVTEAGFEVDLSTITTNESRRDSRVQDALETDQFPTATFTLTEPLDLGDGAADGEAVSVTATGDLTIHGVTESVEFPLEAQLVDGTVVLVGSIDQTLTGYDIEAPSSPVVLSISDEFTVELHFLLVRA